MSNVHQSLGEKKLQHEYHLLAILTDLVCKLLLRGHFLQDTGPYARDSLVNKASLCSQKAYILERETADTRVNK